MLDPSLMALVPGGSIAAVLVFVIGILLRQNHQDRSQYRDHITRTEAEHADEIRAIEARHAEQMARVENELVKLNEKVEAANSKVEAALADLETERHKRWAAEDVAAKARRDLLAAEGRP
jgi:uncharacterized protein YoxC